MIFINRSMESGGTTSTLGYQSIFNLPPTPTPAPSRSPALDVDYVRYTPPRMACGEIRM